jgi:FkbM family methyltransferase
MMQAKHHSASRWLSNLVFGALNDCLGHLAGKTAGSRLIFDFFGRILPIPRIVVRGIPIKVIMPLNQIGVFNTAKTWESREPEVLDWIDGFDRDCTFFDVGASFGTETLYAALKPNGPHKIVAFDLSLQSSFNLAYNISLNNITNVTQYYLALSDSIKLIPYSEPTQYYSVNNRPKYDNISYRTISVSMDYFIKMIDLFPDYIKIDVDGAELSIISGMKKTLQDPRLQSLVIEVSDASEPGVVALLTNAGFKIAGARKSADEDTKNIIFTRT